MRLVAAILVLALIGASALPDVALAQGAFSLPAGCTAYATVQKRSCVVSHLFTCAGDPEGYQRRVDIDEEGLSYAGMIDAETQWIESEHLRVPASDRLEPGGADPASFSTLISAGLDDWSFQVRTLPDILTEFEGYDRLTGETLVVDGIILEQTEFVAIARIPGGAELWRQTGNEYIQRDWRTFLSGTRVTVLPDETFESDGTPEGIDLPGDPGFLARSPRIGCGAMVSNFESPAFIQNQPVGATILRTAFTGD